MRTTRYSIILIMTVVLCLALNQAIAEETVDFSYAVQVTGLSATSLPTPSVPIDTILSGLEIHVGNQMNQKDRFMLIFICEGIIIPYSQDNTNMAFSNLHSFSVEGCSEISIEVFFDINTLMCVKSNQAILQVVLIGLLDRYPRDSYDNVTLYNAVVSIPIDMTQENDPEGNYCIGSISDYPSAVTPISNTDATQYINNFQFQNATGERIPAIMLHENAIEVSIHFSVIGQTEDIFICFFLNNELVPMNYYDGTIVHMNRGFSYNDTIHLSLAPGSYQLYGLYVPLYRQSDAFITSEKIVLNVEK